MNRSIASERFNRLAAFNASEFGKIGEEARQSLETAASFRVCGSNDFIYLQDDAAQSLHFVRSGHVRLSYLLEDGSAILFAILPPGESFGELGVFENGVHCDMATSVGTSSIFSIPANTIRALAQRHPEINTALGHTIARRYRSYIGLTRVLGLKSLSARLSQCMLRLADGLGDNVLHHGVAVPRIGAFVSQTELGLMARGARGNVNRALKAWERAGWIRMQDRSILILDRNSLEDLAFEDEL